MAATTVHLTEFLASRSVDVLTNSMLIVARLLAEGGNRVTVPGGTIYREQNIILSPYDDDAMGHLWGQRLLTSCCGLNRCGIMEADPLIVQAEMKLLKRADELIVLADSSKLRQRSSMIVAPLERISVLYRHGRDRDRSRVVPIRRHSRDQGGSSARRQTFGLAAHDAS